MRTEALTHDWYAEACRRARAYGRRRRAATASTDWPDFAPPVALSDGPLGEVQAADREIGRQTAVRARAVARFAATRPATADRAQGEPGAMSRERWSARPEVLRPVSEWAGQELVIALSISAQAAETLLTNSLTLVHRLPGTLAALEAGALHPGHLWTMLEKVAPIANPRIRAEVEAELLRWAAGRVTTPAQLGAKARREVLKRDARSAARDLERALKERGVHLKPHTVDGMATVTVVATMPEAQALYRALSALAEGSVEDEDPRTRGQRMVDCLLDLVLRPGESHLPPVQVLLTMVASISTLAGGDAPGEIDGHVVPAEMIRQFLAALFARQQPAADVGPERGQDDAALWDETLRAELAAWGAETEGRVLAEERSPDPGLDDIAEDALGAELPDDAQTAGRGHRSPPAWRPEEASPPQDTPPQQLPDDAGRWAVADRAVDDASLALFQAGRKISRAQDLVRAAAAADDADEEVWRASPAGDLADAEDAITALLSTTDAQREMLAQLLTTTGGGGLVDRPRVALTDALSGALLALTDLPGLIRAGTCGDRECRRDPARCTHDLSGRPGVGPPGPTNGYRPAGELDRWVRARDRRCRAPGCRRRVPRGGELDHSRPYPHGPTSATNLVGYCTGHHRGKHQAPGWVHEFAPEGTLTVTTPTGLTVTTTPPPF